MTYKQYLNSDKWKQKKQALMTRSMHNAGRANRWGICEACGYAPWKPCLQVHHLTYEHLFNEPLEDLILLCSWCHRETHSQNKGKLKPKSKSSEQGNVIKRKSKFEEMRCLYGEK